MSIGGRARARFLDAVARDPASAPFLALICEDDPFRSRLDEIPTLKPERLLRRLSEGAVTNVRFDDLIRLTEKLGFELARVSGSHHVFVHPAIPEILSLQSAGGDAKPYQVRQLILLVEHYDLRIGER